MIRIVDGVSLEVVVEVLIKWVKHRTLTCSTCAAPVVQHVVERLYVGE